MKQNYLNSYRTPQILNEYTSDFYKKYLDEQYNKMGVLDDEETDNLFVCYKNLNEKNRRNVTEENLVSLFNSEMECVIEDLKK